MSKSMWVTCRVLMTDWYAAVSWLRLVQETASSLPAAPPKETIGWAPAASAAGGCGSGLDRGGGGRFAHAVVGGDGEGVRGGGGQAGDRRRGAGHGGRLRAVPVHVVAGHGPGWSGPRQRDRRCGGARDGQPGGRSRGRAASASAAAASARAGKREVVGVVGALCVPAVHVDGHAGG